MHAAAVKPPFELLVGRKVRDVHHGVGSTGSVGASFGSGAGHRASHQTAVETPVETEPRELLRRLVLHMPGRVMDFIMIDAEYAKPNGGGADSGDLRTEKARRHAGRHHKSGQSMEVGHREANGVSGNFGFRPLNRISDRRVCQHAEVKGIVSVLPDVLAVENQVLAKRL